MLQIPDHPDLPVAQRIIEAVHEAVRRGDFAPGDKLPGRLALGRQLRVNDTSVGNAYERLETQGVVVSKRGSGTFIARNPLRQLQQGQAGSPLTCVTMVVGADDLAGCPRDVLQVGADVVAGLKEVLGAAATPIHFVKAFDRACLGHVPDQSAVVLMRPAGIDEAMVDALAQRGIPTLSVWAYETKLAMPKIDYDRHQAARLACEHLIDRGYRQIGYIGQMGEDLGIKFFQFTNTLFKHKLDYKVQHVCEAFSDEPGAAYAAVTRMLNDGDIPEAFVADTDYKAMEVVTALKHAGLRVPEDVGVIGYDGVPMACDWRRLPLTTVRVPRREIGRRAAEALLARARHGTPIQSQQLPAELIVGESTRPIGPGSAPGAAAGSATFTAND